MKNKLIIWTLVIVLLASFIYAGNLNSNSDLSHNEYTQYLGYSNTTIYFNNSLGVPNAILWYREFSDFCNSNTTYATPLAYKGNLYFNCPNETKIIALNATTGTTKWIWYDNISYHPEASYYPFDNNSYYNYKTMAIANDSLIYFAGNQKLYSLNLTEPNYKRLNWYVDAVTGMQYDYFSGVTYSLWFYSGSSPIVYNGYVYISIFNGFFPTLGISPQVIMRFPLTTVYQYYNPKTTYDNTSLFTSDENYWGVLSPLMIFNNTIYTTEYNGGFFAFNASNMSMEWNDTTATAYEFFDRAGIIIYNQTLYTQGRNRVHAYDLNSKSHLCTYSKATADSPISTSTPTIYKNELFVGGSRLRIINYTNCNFITSWTYGNDAYRSSPIVIGDNVYAGTSNATLIVNGSDTSKATLFRGNTTKAYSSGTPDLSLSYFNANPMVSNDIIYLTANRLFAMINLKVTNYTNFYNGTVLENSLESFGLNVTYNYNTVYNINNVFAYFIYNTTTYNATKNLQSNSIYFNISNFVIPSNKSTDNYYWYIVINPNDVTGAYNPMYTLNTSIYQQNITQITPFTVNETACNDLLNPTMCWDFGNEIDLSKMTADIVNYNFRYGVSNGSLNNIYGQLNTSNYFCLCINSTAFNNYTLGYGEIDYQKSGYAERRFYTFSNNRLSNTTINNTLYFLSNVPIYGATTTSNSQVNSTTMINNGNITTYTTTGNITITVTQGNTTVTSYQGNITAYYNATENKTYTVYNPSNSSQIYDPSITNQIYDPSTTVTIYAPSNSTTVQNPTTSVTTQSSTTPSKATPFQFIFKNTGLNPYIANYSALLRWYPNMNAYYVVDMGKTDEGGKTVMNVQTQDADYRVGLYDQSGRLRKLLDPTRFLCVDNQCTYSTLIEDNPSDYTSSYFVQNSIDFNYTSNIWTYIWNDPSQKTNSMRFTVTKDTGYDTIKICDVNSTGFVGVLTCNSTSYRGTLKGTAYRTASPETPIFNKIIDVISSPFTSVTGLFIGFLLFLTLVAIGVYSPAISLVFGVASLYASVRLGSITMAIVIPIAVIVGVVIHFFKRTTQ